MVDGAATGTVARLRPRPVDGAVTRSVVVVVGNAEADAVRALELDRLEPRPLLEFDREARV